MSVYKALKKLSQEVDRQDLAIQLLGVLNYATRKITHPRWTPMSASIEVTQYCAGTCPQCYIPINKRKKEDFKKVSNSVRTLERIVTKCINANIPLIGFSGGEPLGNLGTQFIISEQCSRYPTRPFYVYTNGEPMTTFEKYSTLWSKGNRVHNLAYVLSVNGLGKTHDKTRYPNSFNYVSKAFDVLHQAKKLFGASVTIFKENVEEVTSPNFFDFLVSRGVGFARFRPYTPIIRGEKFNFEEIKNMQETIKRTAENYPLLVSFDNSQAEKEFSKDLLIDCGGNVRTSKVQGEIDLGNIGYREERQITPDIKIVTQNVRQYLKSYK